jgi:hypothetical protein
LVHSGVTLPTATKKVSGKKSTESAKVCLYAMPQKIGNTRETLSERIFVEELWLV